MFFQSASNQELDHGTYLTVSWACLAPIGILSARYFKHTSWWIYVHFSFLTTASILTIYSISQIFQFDMLPLDSLSQTDLEHSRLGMIIVSLVISQVVFGMVTSYFKIFTKNVNAIMNINRLHKVTGFALLIAGLINCYKGWDLYADGMSSSIYNAALVIICVLFALFELFQIVWRNTRRKRGKFEHLDEISHLEAFEMIKNGKELMFADDLVIDIKHFKYSHPGGTYVIEKSIGEDSGKFMIGCKGYGNDFNPYTHSDKAFSYLPNLAIGKIPFPRKYLNQQDSNVDSHILDYTLLDKYAFNDHTFLLYLKSDFFKLNKIILSPTWLGKHFKVIINRKRKTYQRYYSALFTDLHQWASEEGLESGQEKHMEEGVLKFIFKVYPKGKVSPYLNDLKIGDAIKLQGPFGPGFLLSKLEGNFIGYAGGTGLVPFLDLVYYAKSQAQSGSGKFKLSLVVSFRTWKEGFALEILQRVKETAIGNWFNLTVLHDDAEEKPKIKDIVRNMCKELVDLAWICGPPGFNTFYHDLLIQYGIPNSRIILM